MKTQLFNSNINNIFLVNIDFLNLAFGKNRISQYYYYAVNFIDFQSNIYLTW
jgi:hypothetical protein